MASTGTTWPKASTIRKRARKRLRRKGKHVSKGAFKVRKPQRDWAPTGSPRRWLDRQLKGK